MNQPSPLESLYQQEELYAIRPKVLVLLDKAWKDVSPEEQLLLTKILGSVKLNTASIQMLQCDTFTVDALSAYRPERVIAFGAQLQPSGSRYEVLSLQDTSILLADALDALDDQKKKSLWTALRQMFAL